MDVRILKLVPNSSDGNYKLVASNEATRVEYEACEESSEEITVRLDKKMKLFYSKLWEEFPEMQEWLRPSQRNPSKAFCAWCRIALNAVKNDIVNHSETYQHQHCSEDVEQYSSESGVEDNQNNDQLITIACDGTPQTSQELLPYSAVRAYKVQWPKRISTFEDVGATEAFIDIMTQPYYQQQIANPAIKKTVLFQEVYRDLINKGFKVANDVIMGGEKCYQKWRNLKKNFEKHFHSSLITGRKDHVPRYIKLKEMFKPLLESMLTKTQIDRDYFVREQLTSDELASILEMHNIPEGEIETSTSSANPRVLYNEAAHVVINQRKMLKEVFEYIDNKQKEESIRREAQFAKLTDLLTEQAKQTKRIADVLENLAAKKVKLSVSESNIDVDSTS